jgi:hypothetical protein
MDDDYFRGCQTWVKEYRLNPEHEWWIIQGLEHEEDRKSKEVKKK